MVLVDYSESDASDSEFEASSSKPHEAVPVLSQPQSARTKKPFHKVVDRSNPGKIVVSLPQNSSSGIEYGISDEPSAKRARTTGGGLFSGFNSLLPAPKNATKTMTSHTVRPGMSLKTSAEPGFIREADQEAPAHVDGTPNGSPVLHEPSSQKSAAEIELVGKPLIFRPLSVTRNAKNKRIARGDMGGTWNDAPKPGKTKDSKEAPQPTALESGPKKMTLFTLHSEKTSEQSVVAKGTYEPLFETLCEAKDAKGDRQLDTLAQWTPTTTAAPETDSLDSIADELHLSAAARRELFGRDGGHQAAKQVINFNMDQEYQHNEEIRAAGEQQAHNPIRSIQGGKHNLRQLVQKVQNQREALEESFAQSKSNRKEASSRYGW